MNNLIQTRIGKNLMHLVTIMYRVNWKMQSIKIVCGDWMTRKEQYCHRLVGIIGFRDVTAGWRVLQDSNWMMKIVYQNVLMAGTTIFSKWSTFRSVVTYIPCTIIKLIIILWTNSSAYVPG